MAEATDGMIEVQRGIPLPGQGPNGRRVRPQKYPWHKLTRVGDSFLVPVRRNFTLGDTAECVKGAGHRWARRHGIRITIEQRREHLHGETGVRVWRVA